MTKVTSSLVSQGVKMVRQFDLPGSSPMQQQQRVLQQLLKRAEMTGFGRHYDFAGILRSADPVRAFQQQVPLFDYDRLFAQWWHRALAGEADVTWKGAVKYFALSSGTSGAASKYIPVTLDMMRSMRRCGLRMFSCLPKYNVPASLYFRHWLMIGGSANLQDHGHCYAGDLSGINASRPPVWIRRFYKPGTEIARISDWDERTRAIARNAHRWDVGVITGIPSWVQLTLEYILEYYGLDHIHQLWPNLQIYVSGGIAFEPYRKSFERLLGHPLIYMDSYLASEGFIAFQDRPGTHDMRLVLNNGIFFEFVPFDEANFDSEGQLRLNAEVLTLDQVREGVDYALLLSTCAGAWRYLIGDTVRFTNLDRCEIAITGRTKHFLSICGEHLSVDNMNKALQRTEELLDINIPEYTVAGVKSGTHFAHRWYLGSQTNLDPKQIARTLDEQLKIVNDDYRAERSAMLQDIEVTIIPPALFYEYQRHLGKMNGQSKFPRVMRPDAFSAWEQFVSQNLQIL